MNDDLQHIIDLYRQIFPRLSDLEKNDWEENFLVEFTHDSTSIEGNTLTLLDTKMILTDKIVPAETTLRELDEVRGHADAWQFVKECVKNKVELTENIVRDIHEKVMPFQGIGGMYRTVPVYIRGSQHIPPAPQYVWNEMKNLIYRRENDTFSDAVEEAAWFHAEFVKIHPFQDGNGRTARLLMNYILLANNYPPSSIKLKNRKEYFQALEEYSLYGKVQPFAELLAKNMDRELEGFLKMYAEIHLAEK